MVTCVPPTVGPYNGDALNAMAHVSVGTRGEERGELAFSHLLTYGYKQELPGTGGCGVRYGALQVQIPVLVMPSAQVP